MNEILFDWAPLTIEATANAPTFKLVAYTGGLMHVKAFDTPVVVSLDGIIISKQTIPIRLEHKPEQGIGHTTSITVDGGALLAEGIISRENMFSADVVTSGKAGFPWQASIGGPVVDSVFIEEGNTVEVNGNTFKGPIRVVRKMELKEISFVDQGADNNTSATIVANSINNEETKTIMANEKLEAESISKEGLIEASKNELAETINAMRNAVANERKRIGTIESVGKGKLPELEAKAIQDGWTAERFELEFLRQNRPDTHAVQASASQTIETKVLEAVASQAGGMSSGVMEKVFDDKTLEAADRYRGIGLQEFCELACHQSLPRFRRDAHGWLEAAFSTAALPGILSNVANKMLLEGYNYVEDSWRKICKIATVTDFKQHNRYRMNGSFKFEKVGLGGELKHGTLDEQVFTQKADTHGIMFALTRQMIIDDDLGALTDIPRQIGIGAAEAIAEAVWNLLLSNPTQADNKAFFHANHNNYTTGATSNLSIASLTAAEIKFGEQTKPNGRPLGIMPSLLLVPTALKVTAELLMKSTTVNEAAATAAPAMNPHAGKYNIVSSAYLSNPSFTGYSSNAWYLLADPNRLPSLEVAFLGGMDRPTIERADADFNTLGIQFRGYIDFGVREQDYRGILKVKGEA